MSNFDEYFYENVGKKLRQYRKIINLSQEKMAELLGLNYKYIGHIERGERKIGMSNLIKIINFLEVQPVEFFKFDTEYKWN